MKKIWTTVEDGEEFFKNSKNFREAMTEILEKWKKKDSFTLESYDTPSWSHKQAHVNGYNQAIDEILTLLKG